MNRETFRKKIEQELKTLNKEQTIKFAWHCAVRALPFLGSQGNFDFWDIKDRQARINTIFYALDVNSAAYTVYADYVWAAYAAADSDYDVSIAESDSYTAAICAAAAAYAADDTYITNAYTPYTTPDAYISYAAWAGAVAAIVAIKNNINLEITILQDLQALKEGRGQSTSTDVYGEIWNNFQKALETEGCAYWGKLYQNIFDNRFEVDQESLERRMSIPNEKRGQGAAAVAKFLEDMEAKGAVRLNEARIIILGEKGAGKTCLARRLIDPDAPMTTDEESTPGVDTTLWKLEKENINVRIWDFAGHTVTHTVHKFFLSKRCLYIIVYDGRSEERNRLQYWLDHMKNYGGDSKAIMLVNQRDQNRVDIPIYSLKEQYPIEEVYTFSIQDDINELNKFRNKVAGFIQHNPSWEKQKIPTDYYDVKEELEEFFVKGKKERGREHITKEEFDKIAERHNVDNIEELLTDLHELGVSFWYKDMEEFNTLILNPEWISHGVYKIINWLSNNEKFSLSIDDFRFVFSEDKNRYPEKQHKFLFKLIMHYELGYETKSGDRLILPHLLNEDRLEKLPVFSVGDSLMLRYEAEQPLPPNTISRFIVRHNQEIKKENKNYLVWRYGVILEDGKGSIALIREEDRTINVSVKGQDKTNYISVLRETLNTIFNSYKSEKPELQYRIMRFGLIPSIVETKYPLWLSDRQIMNHNKWLKPYFDYITGQDIPMIGVVNNYKIEVGNLIMGDRNQLIDDKSSHTTFNFHNCNINLQGSMNELSLLLAEGGNKEEALELENAAKALELAEKCKSPEEVKKKGIASRLQRLVKDLEDEDSKLHKTVKGIKHGIGIAQDIAKGYNDIAQWAGLPQVPKPFLKK